MIQGDQGIETTLKILDGLTNVSDKDREKAQKIATMTSEQRKHMKTYRSKASACHLQANQSISILTHLVAK